MSEHLRGLQEYYGRRPAKVRRIINLINNTPGNLYNDPIDALLGIPRFEGDMDPSNINMGSLYAKYGIEQFLYIGTPYTYIRHALRGLTPKKGDIIYDLGSGYGRFPLYGALTTEATYKGIELLPERHDAAEAVRRRLRIKNAEFLHGNVLDFDISDGNMFYLYSPFSRTTLRIVQDRLKDIAKDKKIHIAAMWSGEFDPGSDWLKKVYEEDTITKVYESL